MAKLTKTSVFNTQVTKPETPMDKTSRVVKKIVDDESEQRHVKTARLRNARLEREANTPAKVVPAVRKPRPSRAVTK